MGAERCAAFAPGRVNLIGEHSDYNEGLALPFAILEGITVRARRTAPAHPPEGREQELSPLVRVYAESFDERDEFPLSRPAPGARSRSRTSAPGAAGWRTFVRGMVAELQGEGFSLVGAQLDIGGNVGAGSGLSSSAALEVALCLCLIALGTPEPDAAAVLSGLDRTRLAQVCARVENEWVGAQTGLLDQLASLYGAPDTALLIDFRSLEIEPVALRLDGWRLLVLDSGERHAHAASGYNDRRAECAQACALLGVGSLREADLGRLGELPEPLRRRARHVVSENGRVREAVRALETPDLAALGDLLDACHASLRDDFEISTPAVERTVERMRDAGAAGARMVGGGFGGIVLGLFAPGTRAPEHAREVRAGPGAHLLES